MHFWDAHQTQKNREVPLSTVQQSYLEPKWLRSVEFRIQTSKHPFTSWVIIHILWSAKYLKFFLLELLSPTRRRTIIFAEEFDDIPAHMFSKILEKNFGKYQAMKKILP